MKRVLLLSVFIVAFFRLSGQYQGIAYQAVLFDENSREIPGVDVIGNYIPSQAMTMRFSIINENGIIEYQEEHQTSTDKFGMINLIIGWGIITLASPGTFSDIDWDGSPKDLRVEIALGNGSGAFDEFSYEKLLFVPYAFHRNITATGSMIIDGPSTLRSSLDVLNGSPTNLTGNLNVDGTSDLNGSLNVNNGNPAFLTGNLTVSLLTTLNSNLSVNAVSNFNGQVTIDADVNGTDDQYSSYPLRVQGSNQGIGIIVDGSRDNTNNFITFWDSQGIQGRIEGQTDADLLNDPEYIYDQALYAAQTVVQVANLAIAIGAAALDPGNLAIEIANSAALTAEIAGYNVFAFQNLGVTYESGSGDYAEWLPRLDPNEKISFGQIVGVYGGKISKKTDGAEMLMVVSKSPIVLGNMPKDSISRKNSEKVGFLGQVPVWIIGKVKTGDYIVPFNSGSGFGKAIASKDLTIDMMDKIVGIAWSDGNNEFVNLVNTLVGVKNNDWIKFIKSDKEKIASLNNNILALKEENELLKKHMNKTNEILARILPEFKAEMDDKLAYNQQVTIEQLSSGFDLAEEILKSQGVNTKKDKFFLKLNSDSGYKEVLIEGLLKTINTQ
jgi:hypothetical protein